MGAAEEAEKARAEAARLDRLADIERDVAKQQQKIADREQNKPKFHQGPDAGGSPQFGSRVRTYVEEGSDQSITGPRRHPRRR